LNLNKQTNLKFFDMITQQNSNPVLQKGGVKEVCT